MKILWSPLSVERLEEIFEYISKKNSPAAQKMVGRIFKKVEILSEYPERGRKVPEVKEKKFEKYF